MRVVIIEGQGRRGHCGSRDTPAYDPVGGRAEGSAPGEAGELLY
ncbi:hypothetical protein [Streptomyces sp. JCM 35825]|nr:hypothetical protein [Streptomyces sp. JCM 35825]WCL84236.1 hypothetical protein PPN52_06180 [Streptomyces sp. JCM 35825]